MYENAQQMSPIISSESFSISTLARDGMHLATFFKSGEGLPLHKFESVQLAFLMKVLPGYALSKNSAIGTTAPALITRSRMRGPSPAMLPNPQMTYSITSM